MAQVKGVMRTRLLALKQAFVVKMLGVFTIGYQPTKLLQNAANALLKLRSLELLNSSRIIRKDVPIDAQD